MLFLKNTSFLMNNYSLKFTNVVAFINFIDLEKQPNAFK